MQHIPVIITPFIEGAIDFESLHNLLDLQKSNGTKTVLINGTNSESVCLSQNEREELISSAISYLEGSMNVMVGICESSSKVAVEAVQYAYESGSCSALIVAPPYNKPSQDGLKKHFSYIAQNLPNNFPLYLYNNPSRCGVCIEEETIEYIISHNASYVGIKDASGQVRPSQNPKLLQNLCWLYGNDIGLSCYNMTGGSGVISVIGNIIPGVMNRIQQLCSENKFQEAQQLENQYSNLIEAIAQPASPAGIKYAAYKLGIIKTPEIRLPMTLPNEKQCDEIDAALDDIFKLKMNDENYEFNKLYKQA